MTTKPSVGKDAQDMTLSFTNEQPFIVTDKDLTGFTRFKRRFGCSLCGHVFAVGDAARWVYANGSSLRCGNFFVCQKCDGNNEDVLARAKLSFELMLKLVRQWRIEIE